MPLVTSQQSNNGKKAHSDQEVERLDQPRLIRTNSIEQEGLSHFLEQTNLDGSDGGHGDELYRLAASSPLVTTHKSPFSDRFFFPSNQDSSSYPHTSVAAAAVVDECFPNKTQVSASWTIPSPSPLEPSSKAAMRRRMTPRDKKNPEFETLLDEYKLTDIDHELDSFYLDTMEAIGNDLDLMSN
ncbi:hypothetical protein PHYBOEH_008057 [Phytophthora boehmeriae]|uniref:Uncharacterized protein n=1 Tax=Phytophthora boehmeriae TaxID=109152 RepID=A0A8T1X6R0_9STRA|nr:hypothetical protein PHYBOEH_008057 [Phytophthora boehmeriae]